jgi:hypothetical protein
MDITGSANCLGWEKPWQTTVKTAGIQTNPWKYCFYKPHYSDMRQLCVLNNYGGFSSLSNTGMLICENSETHHIKMYVSLSMTMHKIVNAMIQFIWHGIIKLSFNQSISWRTTSFQLHVDECLIYHSYLPYLKNVSSICNLRINHAVKTMEPHNTNTNMLAVAA